jgi:hypothetical protein
MILLGSAMVHLLMSYSVDDFVIIIIVVVLAVDVLGSVDSQGTFALALVFIVLLVALHLVRVVIVLPWSYVY